MKTASRLLSDDLEFPLFTNKIVMMYLRASLKLAETDKRIFLRPRLAIIYQFIIKGKYHGNG